MPKLSPEFTKAGLQEFLRVWPDTKLEEVLPGLPGIVQEAIDHIDAAGAELKRVEAESAAEIKRLRKYLQSIVTMRHLEDDGQMYSKKDYTDYAQAALDGQPYPESK